MVVYFLLGLLSGWTTFFCIVMVLAYKMDQRNKKQYMTLVSEMFKDQDHLYTEDYRKYKS